MHSPSTHMVKESKNLCRPSGASFRSGASGLPLSPVVQFYGHRREELSPVDSITQMVMIGAASGVSRVA